MAGSYKTFRNGIRILDDSFNSNANVGIIQLLLGSPNKIQFNNGASASPIVTEAHAATLTNKTLTSPILNTPTADTITGISGAPLILQSATNQNLILQAQGSGVVQFESVNFDGNTITGDAGSTFVIQSGLNQNLQLQGQGTGSVLFELLTVTSNILQAQSGNDLIVRSPSSQDLYLDGSDDIIFRTSGGLVERASIDDAGKIILGSVSSTEEHAIRGNNLLIQAGAAGNTFGIYRNEATGGLGISGGTALNNGAVLNVFGASNVSFPNSLVISNAGTNYHRFDGSGNVVLGATSSNGRDRLQVNGSISIQRTDNASIGNLIALNGTGFIKLTGSGAKDLHGIDASLYSANNIDSAIISIYNSSNGDLAVKNQSSTEPTLINRIITPTGLDLIIPQGSFVQLRYDGDQNRWIVEQSSSGASGFVQGISTITTNYTLQLTDEVLLVDATSSNIIIDLPQATLAPRKKFTIKKITNDDNFITIQTSGELIDDNSVYTMYYQYDSVTLVSNGTNWYLV